MEANQKRITVALPDESYEALRRFAFDNKISLSAALKVLCETGLENRKYGKLKNDSFKRSVK